jgi:hypothetical protein
MMSNDVASKHFASASLRLDVTRIIGDDRGRRGSIAAG